MCEFLDAKAEMVKKYGPNVILVREPQKVEHFLKKLGEPLEVIYISSSQYNMAAYYVWVHVPQQVRSKPVEDDREAEERAVSEAIAKADREAEQAWRNFEDEKAENDRRNYPMDYNQEGF
jgi:hypothetical protein